MVGLAFDGHPNLKNSSSEDVRIHPLLKAHLPRRPSSSRASKIPAGFKF
jgi:NADH:ubiquinone oxidoreductase subunit C